MKTKKKILFFVLSLTILFSATLIGSEKEVHHLEEIHETILPVHPAPFTRSGVHPTPAEREKVIPEEEHKKEITLPITKEVSPYAKLPLWIILTPLIGAGLLLLLGNDGIRRNIIAFLTTFLTLGLLLSLFKPVVQGIVVNGHQYKGIFYSLPYFPFFNFTFKVDPAGLLIAFISGLIWLLGTVYSFSSLTQEKHSLRYQFFSLTTYAATLGVLLAGDLLTLYIFFEGMVFLPYALFAHRGTGKAVRGANVTAAIGVVSGLSLLAGIFLLYTFTGNLEIQPMAEKINTAMSGLMKYLLAGLMIFGFGGKAGIFFEHIWSPLVYPESPEPTAALSSGAMIKVGAYGIFRTVNMLFVPENVDLINQWLTLSNIGYIVIWIGVITMFLGVLNALISSNSKRMLAYHSVSQMGYIVLGIGCAAYMGTEGAMGLAGAIYHMVNHSLFKACLLLTVGAVYFRTNELDMYKLGGLWRNMPVVAIGMFIAVCGISGIPGFNGFASKTVLHHAILEAYQHSVHFSKTHTPDFGLRIAEIIFVITAAGTFASNTKLFILTFLRKRPEKYQEVKSAPWSMQIPILILSAGIVFIGLFPNLLLEKIIGPALAYFNFNPGSHSYHILYNIHGAEGIRSTIEILYNPITKAFISQAQVIHNLLSGGNAILIGGIMYILGFRFGWFHLEVPRKWQIEYYYLELLVGFRNFCRVQGVWFAEFVKRIVSTLVLGISEPKTLSWKVLSRLEQEYEQKASPEAWKKFTGWGTLSRLEQGYEQKVLPEAWKKFALWKGLGELDKKYNQKVVPEAWKKFVGWRILSGIDRKYETGAQQAISGISGGGAKFAPWQPLSEIDRKYETGAQQAISGAGKGFAAWRALSGLDKKYERAAEKMLPVGKEEWEILPEAEKRVIGEEIAPSFVRFCRKLSNLQHTGDLGTYITAIVFILTISLAVLTGVLYIRTFQTVVIIFSVIILFAIFSLFLTKPRKPR